MPYDLLVIRLFNFKGGINMKKQKKITNVSIKNESIQSKEDRFRLFHYASLSLKDLTNL